VEENRVEVEENHVEYTVEEATEFDEGQEIDLKTILIRRTFLTVLFNLSNW
jgi:hypothetical protein